MRVLFVCTGNLCRSPVAERLTSARAEVMLGEVAAEVQIGSAGTDAGSGDPVHPASAAALTALGGDPAGFASRPLVAEEVRSADLVLTMTRRHRHTAITAAPTALRHTFTLREAAGLLAGVDAEDLASVPLADRGRVLAGRLQAARRLRPSTRDDDTRDPIGRSASVHAEVAEEIAALLGPLTEVLFAPVLVEPGEVVEPAEMAAPATELDVTGTDEPDVVEVAEPVETDPPVAAPVTVVAAVPLSAPGGPGTAGDRREPGRPDRRGQPRSDRGRGRRR